MMAEQVFKPESMQSSFNAQQHSHLHHKKDAGQQNSSQRQSILPRKQQEQLQQQQHSQQQQELQQLRWWQQLLLMAGLFGNEATVTFEQIYTFLSLQYVGVPVSLMSLPGVFGGFMALGLVPGVGYLVNKGSNQKLRKALALLLTLSILLSGYLLVSLACTLKLMKELNAEHDVGHTLTPENHTSSYAQYDTTMSPCDLFPNTSSKFQDGVHASLCQDILQNESKEFTKFISSKTTPNSIIQDYNTSSDSHPRNTSDQPEMTTITSNGDSSLSVPLSAVLGILGFGILDIGFGLSNSIVRAFVLDYAPPSQHDKMLVSATLTASVAGTLMSFIGIFDLQSALRDIFHVDGVAAAFLLIVSILVFVVISSFACTFFTAKMLKNRFKNDSANTYAPLADSSSAENLNNEKRIQCIRKGSGFGQSDPACKTLGSNSGTNSQSDPEEDDLYATIKLSSTDNGNEVTPLLLDRKSPNNEPGYKSLSFCNSSLCKSEGIDVTMSSAESLEIGDWNSNIHINDGFEPLASDVCNFYSSSGEYLETKHLNNSKPVKLVPSAAMGLSGSNSSDLWGEFHPETMVLNESPGQKVGKTSRPLLDKRVILLMVSGTCSYGSMVAIAMFMANALTIGILHGDPAAKPGTEGHEKYKDGLRTSALGNLVFYISYFLTCVFNNKIFELIGEKMQFLVCHLLLAGSVLAVLLIQRVEVYFLCMAIFGPFRTCTFTVPFILANKFTHEGEETANGDNQDGSNSSKAGRVMVLLWSLLPLSDLIICSVMGPLIDVTGTVMVPLIWSVVCNVISMLAFSALCFVQPTRS